MKNKDIYDLLCEKFPPETALGFDNSGFLVGDLTAATKGIVIALDCDIDTARFAIKNGCNLIITHHPVIFNGIKNVTAGSVVHTLVKHGISVISMHTNMDFAANGVNDALCAALGFENVTPIEASDGCMLRKCSVEPISPYNLALRLKASLNECIRYTDSGNIIENILVCSGSGGDFLNDAYNFGCQALITADVKHNVFIDSINCGISVFDAGHFATEDVIVEPLLKMLSKKFYGIKILTYHTSKIKSC